MNSTDNEILVRPHKYPSITTFNNNGLKNLDNSEANNCNWYIQEKLDGSQLTFRVVQNSANDKVLECFNKGHSINMRAPLFQKAIDMIKYIKDDLNLNFTYHSEAICNIRHNIVVYQRMPTNYVVVYDIQDETGSYLDPEKVKLECNRLGLEYVQIIYENKDPHVDPYNKCKEIVKELNLVWEHLKYISSNIKNTNIDTDEFIPVYNSMLGGPIEGIVFKHHQLSTSYSYTDQLTGEHISKTVVGPIKKKMVAKIFKEKRDKTPKMKLDPTEFLSFLGKLFSTEARFQKAYQHLIERGEIDPDRIKMDQKYKENILHTVIVELNDDFEKEYKKLIMQYLWAEFSPTIMKEAREGLYDWWNK